MFESVRRALRMPGPLFTLGAVLLGVEAVYGLHILVVDRLGGAAVAKLYAGRDVTPYLAAVTSSCATLVLVAIVYNRQVFPKSFSTFSDWPKKVLGVL
jgi:hypothetical protein